MLISEYDEFVRSSDRSVHRAHEERIEIAIYGLAGEIGSIVAAIKKRLLSEDGALQWNAPSDEIVEELGDAMWYCFALARLSNEGKPKNIFAHDIENLIREIGGTDERAQEIRHVLGDTKRDAFLRAASEFPKRTREMVFDDYQKIAFLTARTEDRTLIEVCLAVLWQLSAQLLRRKLPPIEQGLNTAVATRPINDLLGEIAWHISALASIYQLKLGEIAARNKIKVSHRLDRNSPTPLHDEDSLEAERFPRSFEIAIVTVGPGRSRMFLGGKQIGDDLTDNAHFEDGYRFHDVMHLANVAKLGWSPVFRALLKRKRKGQPKIDEVEDGARAQIVEEVVVKAIHSEGCRLASSSGTQLVEVPNRLFPNREEITFRFLKSIRSFVQGLEVAKNRDWEWIDAITEGHNLFYQLRCEEQGTVRIDLNARSVEFCRDVCVDSTGRVAGLGSASSSGMEPGLDVLTSEELGRAGTQADVERLTAQKIALLRAIGISSPAAPHFESISVTELADGKISVKASGEVRKAMWARSIVGFRTTSSRVGESVLSTAIAVADG
jgi:NTP pyrophosphatase (non-canonical NTP hydrolase)